MTESQIKPKNENKITAAKITEDHWIRIQRERIRERIYPTYITFLCLIQFYVTHYGTRYNLREKMNQ